jgi:hypothetical protein
VLLWLILAKQGQWADLRNMGIFNLKKNDPKQGKQMCFISVDPTISRKNLQWDLSR